MRLVKVCIEFSAQEDWEFLRALWSIKFLHRFVRNSVSTALGPLSRQGRSPRFDKVSSFIAKKLDLFAERITGGQSWAIRGNRGCLIDSVLAVSDRAAF